jgi:2-(acetamidomethylene)succinate hydrolase
MSPVESFLDLPTGAFRALTWGSGHETVLFLHGLSGIAEVWGPTVEHLAPHRRYVALDQRGHGRSPRPPGGYGPGAFVRDTLAAIDLLGRPVHLVGHSMGARIAMLVAARHPAVLRTAAIVDIGPEASKANIRATIAGVSSRPEEFENEADALAFAFRNRAPSPGAAAMFLARLESAGAGRLRWRSSREALEQTVRSHRSRSYWREWRSIRLPALFVHGGASNEVSVAVADRMRAANPGIRFERYDSVGHNIPLIAPERLAQSLERLWAEA